MATVERQHSDHGNSPAAWTAVTLMVVGSLVCAVAFPLTSLGLFGAGLAIGVLGLVVGKVMAMAGYGNLPSYTVEEPSPTTAEGPTLSSEDRRRAHER